MCDDLDGGLTPAEDPDHGCPRPTSEASTRPFKDDDGVEQRSACAGQLSTGAGRASLTETALVGLFVLALLWTLRASATVAMPIVLAAVLYLLLRPIVELLERIRIPSAIGSLVVLMALIGVVATAVTILDSPTRRWAERIPPTMRTLEKKLDSVRKPVAEVQRAAEQVEEITVLADSNKQEVQLREPSLLENAVQRMQSVMIGGAITLATLYFMLVFGRSVTDGLADSSSSTRTLAPEAIRAIERHVSRYLLTITTINCILGAVVAAAMAVLGMPNPLLWGAMATLVNFIPYLGAMVGAVILAVVGILTFDEVGAALMPALVYYALTVTEGTIITPTILGRTHRLNPLVLFVWLVLWGWMWGIMGALLAVPLLVTFKIVCDSLPRCDRLAKAIGRS